MGMDASIVATGRSPGSPSLGFRSVRRALELAAIVDGVARPQIGSAPYVGSRRYLFLRHEDGTRQWGGPLEASGNATNRIAND